MPRSAAVPSEPAVGIVGQNLFPGLLGPLVVAQVDPEDGPRRIDGGRRDDAFAPREAVDQLGEAVAVGLQFVLGQAGVVEVDKREITGKALVAFGPFSQIVMHPVEDFRRLKEVARARSRIEIGGALRDPFLEDAYLLVAWPRLFLFRGHLAADDALEQLRPGGIAWNDPLAGHQLLAVQHEVEAPLDRAHLTVAAVTGLLENCPGLLGQCLRVFFLSLPAGPGPCKEKKCNNGPQVWRPWSIAIKPEMEALTYIRLMLQQCQELARFRVLLTGARWFWSRDSEGPMLGSSFTSRCPH